MEVDRKKILTYGMHAVILLGVIYAAVKYLNGAEVLEALRNFDYIFAPLMLALSAGYLLLKAWRFVVLLEPLEERLPRLVTAKAYVAGQAATLLPGGIAARAGLMKQVDVSVAKSSVAIIFSSGLDQAVFILGGLIAALYFPAARTPVLIILGVLAVVAALALWGQTRDFLLTQARRVAGRFNFEEQWERFLDAVPVVLNWKTMGLGLGITLIAFAFKIFTLDFALRGAGLDVPYPSIFLAFILPTMLGRIFPVPGGVGVTEAGMVGFLTSTTQVDPDTATAAVAIFRIATILFQAIIGAALYFVGWSGDDEMASAAAVSD